MKKNKIVHISFNRDNNEIRIHLKKRIPNTGYGSKKIIEMLKKWDNNY